MKDRRKQTLQLFDRVCEEDRKVLGDRLRVDTVKDGRRTKHRKHRDLGSLKKRKEKNDQTEKERRKRKNGLT